MRQTASSSSSSGGAGFLTLLTILFIGLKLTGHIDWSWFWVLSPMLIPLIILSVFVVFCVAMWAIVKLSERRKS